jgi:hypothetical protein
MTGRVTPKQSQMVSGRKSATAYLSEYSVAICWQIMLQLARCECDNATQSVLSQAVMLSAYRLPHLL